MNKYKESIIFKSVIITLVMTLLVPSFVKLAHAFVNHKHEICETPQKRHYHELDLDCEFYKFKLSTAFNFQPTEFNFTVSTQIVQEDNFYKSFFNNLHIAQTSLRGPPQLI